MADAVTMEGLIDHLSSLLAKRFANDVSRIYFGDIGVYNPIAFGGDRKNPKLVVALSPSYNRLIEDERNAAYELRLLGLDIIVFVNITPYFQADPPEAYGERKLVRITTQIAEYLTLEENINLGGRVQFSKVGSIDFSWVQRSDQSLRAAGVAYECRVRIPRIRE
jgi:hypothetical protein